MIAFLDSIPASVMVVISGFLMAILGAYFSRKQTAATVADKITLAAGRSLDRSAQRMDVLESEAARTKRDNAKLAARVSSLEHNEIENQKWIKSLEGMHERLQADHRNLKRQYDELLERYRRLKDQVEHGSSPHLTAGKG